MDKYKYHELKIIKRLMSKNQISIFSAFQDSRIFLTNLKNFQFFSL